MAKPSSGSTGHMFERVAGTLAALAIVGMVLYLLVRNEPIADERLFFALRVVLSLCAATLGATIPGFLSIDWSGKGLAVRAGGALALFVLTYGFTPDLAPRDKPGGQPTVSAPGGVAVGTNTNSPITINPPATPPATPR